jgi:alpha-N-arabinofuranosidase
MFHTLPDLFMTNLAQTNNVLQALVLTDGARMLRTPTYHVWEMFMPHRDGTLIECEADGVSASATLTADGTVTLSVVNTSLDEAAELSIQGVRAGRLLTAEDVRDHNTFVEPDRIVPRPTESTTVPPHSLAVFTLG